MLCLFELALIVWGTFPCSNGHFLDFLAVLTLTGMVWDTYIVINQKLQIRIGLFTANCKQGPEKVHLSALLADEERSKAIWVCLIMPYIDGALFMKGLHIRASL